jgi:hypothetical protein
MNDSNNAVDNKVNGNAPKKAKKVARGSKAKAAPGPG